MACIVTSGEDAFLIRRILHVVGANFVYSVSKIVILLCQVLVVQSSQKCLAC